MNVRLALLLAACLAPAAAQEPAGSSPEQGAAALFASGRSPETVPPEIRAVLRMPDMARTGERGLVWSESGRDFELRQNGYRLVLQAKGQDGAPPFYAVFDSSTAGGPPKGDETPKPKPKSPSLEILSAGRDPFKEGKGARWSAGGAVVIEQNRGNTPLFGRGFTAPYISGPGMSADLKIRMRRPSTFAPGLDFTVTPSYAAGGSLARQGRAEFLVRADLAVTKHLGFQVGHRASVDRGRPADYAATQGNPNLQRTWWGVRLMPFGMDAKSGFEWFFNLSEIPGGSKRHFGPNNWPVRVRGQSPSAGWDIGMEGKYTWRKVEFLTRGTILGSTPFDNPEMLQVLFQVSVDVTKRLFLRVRNENSANINQTVIHDPNASRPGSMTHTTTVGVGVRF